MSNRLSDQRLQASLLLPADGSARSTISAILFLHGSRGACTVVISPSCYAYSLAVSGLAFKLSGEDSL